MPADNKNNNNNNSNIVSGISVIFIANLISMVLNGLLSFILPKYLSIESYGELKTFQLYLSYAGITGLGFVDGVYLRYGGTKIEHIPKKELEVYHGSYRVFNIVLAVITVFVAVLLKNEMLLLVGLIFVPFNVSNYYRTFFQAVGEFKRYANILAFIPLLTIVLDLIALFVLGFDNPLVYMLILLITNVLAYIYLEAYNTKIVGSNYYLSFDIRLFYTTAKSGIALLLSNFTSVLLTSMDRLFVKACLSVNYFSYFSFAVTLENMFNTATAPVTVTLYNYFCSDGNAKDVEAVKTVNKYCSIASVYLISAAFVCKIIIANFIPKYIEAVPIIFILLGAHVFYFVIKSVYVNYQKASGEKNIYLKHMVITLLVGTISNYIATVVKRDMIGFATSTFISAALWFVLNIYRYRKSIVSFKAVMLQTASILLFFFFATIDSALLGFTGYLATVTIVVMVLLKKEFLNLINNIYRQICKKI
ncbi:TPA: hypothetical protein IV312_002454 [Enterococcus faecium]|nr:hypothetical protein [Enterococcus faecium]